MPSYEAFFTFAVGPLVLESLLALFVPWWVFFALQRPLAERTVELPVVRRPGAAGEGEPGRDERGRDEQVSLAAARAALFEALQGDLSLPSGTLFTRKERVVARENWRLMRRVRLRVVIDVLELDGALLLRSRQVVESLGVFPFALAMGFLVGQLTGAVLVVCLALLLMLVALRGGAAPMMDLSDEAFDAMERTLAGRFR